jgi:hypothetical protein
MLDHMTPRQQIFALVMSVALLVFVIEMVRRRRLREEYSWLWILVAVAILVVSAWFGLLLWLTNLIGAVTPVSTFFVFGILFLMVVNIYFSIKVSTLTTQVKNLAQRLAIMSSYLQELREGHSRQTLPMTQGGVPERGMPFAPGGEDPTGEYREQVQKAADAPAPDGPANNAGRSSGDAGPPMAAGEPEAGALDPGEAKD